MFIIGQILSPKLDLFHLKLDMVTSTSWCMDGIELDSIRNMGRVDILSPLPCPIKVYRTNCCLAIVPCSFIHVSIVCKCPSMRYIETPIQRTGLVSSKRSTILELFGIFGPLYVLFPKNGHIKKSGKVELSAIFGVR